MPRGEPLPDLDAAPMPVHVAEAADIHQDVEAELLAGARRRVASHRDVRDGVTRASMISRALGFADGFNCLPICR